MTTPFHYGFHANVWGCNSIYDRRTVGNKTRLDSPTGSLGRIASLAYLHVTNLTGVVDAEQGTIIVMNNITRHILEYRYVLQELTLDSAGPTLSTLRGIDARTTFAC